ncbi:AI-2E family transporter [Pararoseomonas sp. SCSIO 73927]|uniref:AI-2E family transporter n=1 Tax=Pararoseomonas sp. SCSIO 73927 TaxID=3114537 RepID=UPI0030CD39C9
MLAALILALWFFSGILTPFVLAVCIAYFLDPVAARLARIGVPRWLGAGLLVAGLMTFALICLLLLYPLLISQIGVLLARLPVYVTTIGARVQEALAALEQAMQPMMLDPRLTDLAVSQVGSILVWLGTSATRLIGGGYALFNVFTFAVVTPVVAFYLLRDWPRLIGRLETWLPRRNAAVLRQLAHDTDRVLSAWLRGQLICCGLLAVYYALVLSAVGLELGLLVGLLAGIFTFIPYVGSLTGMATAILLAVGQFGSLRGVAMVAGVFLIGQIVEGYIIYPRLLGDRVELHAVWVIFALFAGGVAFGFLGVLLAVPIAAAIGVLARYWLRRYLESPLYLDPPRTGA